MLSHPPYNFTVILNPPFWTVHPCTFNSCPSLRVRGHGRNDYGQVLRNASISGLVGESLFEVAWVRMIKNVNSHQQYLPLERGIWQGVQPGALWQTRGVGLGVRDGREVQEGGDGYIPINDSWWCMAETNTKVWRIILQLKILFFFLKEEC